jgi:hypothetical protein
MLEETDRVVRVKEQQPFYYNDHYGERHGLPIYETSRFLGPKFPYLAWYSSIE